MSWQELVPPQRSVIAAPIRIRMNNGYRGRNPFLSISMRPDLMPIPLTWLVEGGTVSVFVGQAEHAGILRLTPKGVYKLQHGTRASKAALLLKLKGLAVITRFPIRTAEFTCGPNWLEIDIRQQPDKAAVSARGAVSTAVPAPAKAKGKGVPFSMASGVSHDTRRGA